MKARLLQVVFIVSFLLPAPHLRAVGDGSFSGGNPNVFTPAANQTNSPLHPHIHAL